METMKNWQKQLGQDPLPALLASGDQALIYFVRRDLLGEDVGPAQCLWDLPAVQKILKKQLPDGSWPWHGANKHPAVKHRLVETWRSLRFLVEQYGLTREHTQIPRAAEYIFTCQTAEGDLRGILANQYATYYTGAITATLIQAGYTKDPRTLKALDWLLSMRQVDGGWTIPMLTHKLDRKTQYRITTQYAEALEPDRSKPFSHNWTGMILRAFALHPDTQACAEVLHAAGLLKSRFFQQDAYSSYRAASYWVRFEYPFWWNNLVSALDSLSHLGLPAEDGQIKLALDWLAEHQPSDGLWKLTYARPDPRESKKAKAMKPWVTLAICRLFKRFYA
jgi:hypothetical protein